MLEGKPNRVNINLTSYRKAHSFFALHTFPVLTLRSRSNVFGLEKLTLCNFAEVEFEAYFQSVYWFSRVFSTKIRDKLGFSKEIIAS